MRMDKLSLKVVQSPRSIKLQRVFDMERRMPMYTYWIVKEDFYTGQRAKRRRKISRNDPLKIGGLYIHLGENYPGCYRVLELIEVEEGVE